MDLAGAVHDVGELRMMVTNWGMFGSMPGADFPFSSQPSAEWPTGSSIEYLFQGGIWISSSTWSPRVSTAVPLWEFRPTPPHRNPTPESADRLTVEGSGSL
jgi:hypothetical protein